MIEKLNLRSSYKYYKRSTENPVEINLYLKIVIGFILFIVDKMFKGYDVQLSNNESLGAIGIRGRKVIPVIDKNGEIKGVAPSWGKTNKLWNIDPVAKANKVIVYCFNEHTSGYKYKLIWYKFGMKLANHNLYSFNFNRCIKRRLSNLLNNGEGEFHTLENE